MFACTQLMRMLEGAGHRPCLTLGWVLLCSSGAGCQCCRHLMPMSVSLHAEGS